MNDPIREALAPFAAITEDDFKGSVFEGRTDDTEVLHFHASGREITMGDFRRARAALAAPAAPQKEPAITLSGAQLLEALEYIAPDHASDPQQLESDATIQWGDGHAGEGYYCWHSDYPDEGSILLDGTTVITAALPPTIQDPLMVAAPQAGEDARQAAWRPLTDEDRQAAFEALPDMLEGFLKKWGWLHFANEIERRCKEKNTALTTQGASHE